MNSIKIKTNSDGTLTDDKGKTLMGEWGKPSITQRDLLIGNIGELIDFVLNNTKRNVLSKLAAFDKSSNTERSQLNPVARSILGRLTNRNGSMTVGQLKETLTNVSPELTRLEKAGLIKREISTTNRKYINVFLTTRGVAVMEEYHKGADNYWRDVIMAPLNDDEIVDMFKAVVRYNYYLNKLNPTDALFVHPAEKSIHHDIEQNGIKDPSFKVTINNQNFSTTENDTVVPSFWSELYKLAAEHDPK